MKAYFDPFGQPRVEIEVRGMRAAVQVAAILDTGFDGELSLPISIAMQLGLELRDVITVELVGFATCWTKIHPTPSVTSCCAIRNPKSAIPD